MSWLTSVPYPATPADALHTPPSELLLLHISFCPFARSPFSLERNWLFLAFPFHWATLKHGAQTRSRFRRTLHTIVVPASNRTIVRLANQIVADAYRQNASDIHIEPYGEKRETLVRFRVDGDCFEYMKIPQSYQRAIVSRLKIMASLDIAERRKPQDGKIKFKLSESREIGLRVATLPTSGYNEDVVMRILAASEPLPLDKMGFADRNLKALRDISAKPYGIILCVGPTGSGKTTTLHSVLGNINTPGIKIWTADTGIEASLTGHFVLSTLHTNNAVETVTRLLDMVRSVQFRGCDARRAGARYYKVTRPTKK